MQYEFVSLAQTENFSLRCIHLNWMVVNHSNEVHKDFGIKRCYYCSLILGLCHI